jgi:hypothetical protein
MAHLSNRDGSFVQAVSDRHGRKSRPVFDPAEPLFFGSRDENAVAHQASGRIAVIRVNP